MRRVIALAAQRVSWWRVRRRGYIAFSEVVASPSGR
jgi:hypothetical protein